MASPEIVESLERATLAAVAPAEVLELDGWLVGLDPGTIRRAASAVPLRHDPPLDLGVLDRIEAAFRSCGLAPAFRLADDAHFDALRGELTVRGYVAEQPTLVKTGTPQGLVAVSSAEPGEAAPSPDAGWGAVFLGEGFDPVDGANRVAAMSRSPDAVYGAVRDDGVPIAVGVAAFGHGWVSVHGMRTDKARRGEGLAGRVLAGLGRAAQARGIGRVFLQVEEANAPARSLYRRAGFTPAWRYLYWSRPD